MAHRKQTKDERPARCLTTATGLFVLVCLVCFVGVLSIAGSSAVWAQEPDAERFDWPAWQVVLGFVIALTLIGAVAWYLAVRFPRAKRRQLRSMTLAASALNNINDGTIMVSARRRVIFCNDRFLEMYGLRRADVRKGLSTRELVEMRRRNGNLTLDTDDYLERIRSGEVQKINLPGGRLVLVRSSGLANGSTIYTHQDCSAEHNLARQLAETKQFLEMVVDNIPVCVAVKSLQDGRYILANRAFEELSGISRDRIVGEVAENLFSLASARAISEADHLTILNPHQPVHRQMIIQEGRTKRTLETTRVIACDEKGEPAFLVALFKDVTELNALSSELEETRKFLELVVDHIPIALEVKRISDGQSLIINQNARSLMHHETGDAKIAALGKPFLRRPDIGRNMEERDWAAINSGTLQVKEDPVQMPEGLRLFLTRRVTIPDGDGKPQYLVKTNEDITDRRETETRMAHMAYHDSLTRLPNRAAFVQTLNQMIEVCEDNAEEFSILSVDIDQLKEINDVFGHVFGDLLIVELTRRMQDISRSGVLARLDGDEFGLILDGPQPGCAYDMANQLRRAVDEEFVINGKTARISLTIGIAVFPSHGRDAASLLAHAGAALFRAKSSARGSVCIFEAAMDQQIRDRRVLHQDLAAAIRRGELRLHYQPLAKIDTDGNGSVISGFEVLARWFHPTRGMIPPAVFIPLAENSSLIVEIGEWILREACREAASWPRPLQVSVNLSPTQFKHSDMVELVQSVLLETGLNPSRLVFEITEGVLISDTERGLALLRRLKSLGIGIAMDDFGSGYSSLTYLQAFPFDKIKIDQAFVKNLGQNPQSEAIVRAVIGLGHGLGIELVGEGVETREQLDFLVAEGCDEVQGYLLGRPAAIEDYAAEVGKTAVPKRGLRKAGI